MLTNVCKQNGSPRCNQMEVCMCGIPIILPNNCVVIDIRGLRVIGLLEKPFARRLLQVPFNNCLIRFSVMSLQLES